MKIEFKINYYSIFWSVCIFFYVYDIGLINLSSILSSRKIVFVFLLALLLIKKIFCIDKSIINLFLVSLIIFIYSLFISLQYHTTNSEYTIINRFFFYILYGTIGTCLITSNFKGKLNYMLQCFRNAGLIQSIIIIALFYSTEFRIFADRYFINEGNVSFLRITDRGTGLGAEGAYLTVLLFISFFSAFIMCKNKIKHNYINYLSMLVLMFSMFLVGRTGLYCTVILLLIQLLFSLKKIINFNIKKIIFFILIVFVFGLFLVPKIESNDINSRIEKQFMLLGGIFDFEDGDRTINHLKEMKMPSLTIETFFGYGIRRGEVVNNYSWHDSGYIQLVYSIGIIGSILFYFSISFFLLRKINKLKNHKNFWIIVFYYIVLFIIELKEPFFLSSIPLCFFIVLIDNLIEECKTNAKTIDKCYSARI